MGDLIVISDADEMRRWTREQRRAGKRVAFVPTMGYLHEGHLSLVRAGLAMADVVVSSIYVNPTQFSKNEDFDVYPRQPDVDRQKLASAGCAVVFEPESLYSAAQGGSGESGNVVGKESGHPDSHETFVQVERLQKGLCGESRPHFFRGVATVVTKLFNIVEPDVALFGKKDYQQLCVIKRMVRDLDFGIEIVGMPICREPDGLAMSSRNARLSDDSRKNSLCISSALRWARKKIAAAKDEPTLAVGLAEAVKAHAQEVITAAGGEIDYAELVDATNMSQVSDITSQPTLMAIAAFFPAKDRGTVRLIDNTVLGEKDESLDV